MQLSRAIQPAILAIGISTRSLPTLALMIGADLLALSLAGCLSVYFSQWWEGTVSLDLYWQLWPLLGLFILAYALIGLYPGVALSPVDELRSASLSTTLMYLVMGSAIFLLREGEIYSRSIFLLAGVFSLALIPLIRSLCRYLFAAQPWWGYPVMVLGAGHTGEMVIRTLKRRPGIGLKPIVVLDDDLHKWGTLHQVPVMGGLELAPGLARSRRIPYAIIAMPSVPRDRLLYLLERYGQTFAHLLVIPDLYGFSSLWVEGRDLGGILGLEVRQRLLLPVPRLFKLLIDLMFTLIGGTLVLPLIVLIALLIKLDSPGPIFYSQVRIGYRGQHFRAWKFRSMVKDADQRLKLYLESHPGLQENWQKDQKLRHDPRITRVGRFLRRTSLDELPQLWNILRGEMSLVGPRPIIDEEIWRYGDLFDLYKKVTPGLTGLWQVSGRNDLSYDERVGLDAYYVRNWSVWLDVYILMRTVWVVLSGEGAY